MQYTLKSTLLLLLCAMSFISCKKDDIIADGKKTAIGTFINNSGVNIKIIPYYKHFSHDNKTLNIENTSRLEVGNSMDWYTGNAPGYEFIYNDYDSFRVVYNDQYWITQVSNIDDSLVLSHHIPYQNNMHFLNPENYYWWYDEASYTIFNEFTFTPEHYEFAKANGMLVE